MMVQGYQRRTREFNGPAPHSVAIKARAPNKRPPEYLILQRRKEEEARQRHNDMTEYNKTCDLKNEWERWTDKKIQLNTVERRVRGMLQAHEFSIEARRQKLRDLLLQEEAQHMMEMAAKEETVLERQAKMRTRAKQLKEQREAERMAVVHQKLEQQFKDSCEELRSTRAKRMQDQVAIERLEQLQLKEEQHQRDLAEEKIFADLWEADRQAKARREEMETRKQMAANQEMLEVLQQQKAALAEKKKEEERLLAEEAKLMEEQKQLRKLEEQAALEEKERRARETRQMLDRTLKLKMEREAREEQEQLAFDMKILEALLEASRNEAMEQAQRKKELREEDQRYRAYLEQLKMEEAAREKELERLCDIEVEKMWQKKLAQWRLEKAARKKLLEEVLASRRMQVAERLMENERKMAEAAREREEITRRIEENAQYEKDQAAALKQKHLLYQDDLIHQMGYNNRQREIASAEQERMWLAQRDAEIEYQKKVELALQEEESFRMHPFRRAVSGRRSAANSCPPAF